QSAREQG
nr:RecName: Full=Unknown protein from spot P11 of 2D-PAGE of heart tissue [Rattus norvegicus]